MKSVLRTTEFIYTQLVAKAWYKVQQIIVDYNLVTKKFFHSYKEVQANQDVTLLRYTESCEANKVSF